MVRVAKNLRKMSLKALHERHDRLSSEHSKLWRKAYSKNALHHKVNVKRFAKLRLEAYRTMSAIGSVANKQRGKRTRRTSRKKKKKR